MIISEQSFLFDNLDIAMRQPLPPSILALTVTKRIFQKLCRLDENGFFINLSGKD